jgi:hypothetical protein
MTTCEGITICIAKAVIVLGATMLLIHLIERAWF